MATNPGELNAVTLAADRKALAKLDELIHVKGRLAIVSVLAAAEALSFTELRDALELTDGNLAAHLRALHRAGYTEVRKRTHRAKPATLVSLTSAGRAAFARYLQGLQYIVQRHR